MNNMSVQNIIICLLLVSVGFFIGRSAFLLSFIDDNAGTHLSIKSQNGLLSLSESVIHYATTRTTPRQTRKEISVIHRVLRRKSPCNFLIFGLGYDSLMWATLNYGGRTVFLEDNKAWIRRIAGKFPSLIKYHQVVYNTKLNQSESEEVLTTARKRECCYETVVDPRNSECVLAQKGLPKEIYEVEWDLIMVDAPSGYDNATRLRMSMIYYTVGLMARNRRVGETDVFVHDVDRVIEEKFSMQFLCEGYMVKQEGRLRHFNIPSHRSGHGRPYCPPVLPPTQD